MMNSIVIAVGILIRSTLLLGNIASITVTMNGKCLFVLIEIVASISYI